VCGTNTLPTLKPQQENNPNKKSNQIQTPQCGVQYFSAHTHTKKIKEKTGKDKATKKEQIL
jgi:hypothetical protein